MVLSRKAKEAIKTALAMTIAYGIALSMDWDKPYWAGFAVAFVSLSTIGQSMNKATLRMVGTLVAIVVAFMLIALFAQERWLFMLFLIVWLGICTYMMAGTKHQYFWNVCAFVCVIICMDAGPNAANAFEIATLRAQETGLGILVYSLVAIFLWPSSGGADFNAAAVKLAATQHQLLGAYRGLLSNKGDSAQAQELGSSAAQAKAHFDQLLAAASTDDYEVWELRRQWQHYQRLAAQLAETLERWREGFAEVQSLDLPRLLPNLESYAAELDARLEQVDRMLANQAPARQPAVIELAFDRAVVGSLSHFHKAALAVTRDRLQQLEVLTGALFDCVSDIRDFGHETAPAVASSLATARFVPDPERITSVVRLMATMWLAWLALIYIDGLPGGAGFVSMACPLGMALATAPQLAVSRLFVPATFSVLVAGVAYIFVMPLLSSFWGLGFLIFTLTFAICYLFAAPQQGLGRAFGLAMFVSIASISNEQSYNFLTVANTALMLPLMFLLLAITAHIPFSPRPESTFLRLLGRFFKSSGYLVSTLRWDPASNPSRLDHWRKVFHSREVSTLPRKLQAWAPLIGASAPLGTSTQQVQAVVTSLQTLTNRMQALIESRDDPQAGILVQQLLEDIRAWRLRVEETFQRLSENPATAEREAFRTRLEGIMGHMETRIEEAMDRAADGQLSDQDAENFYRLLGAYRGVSEALVDYAGNADVIDWSRWREERFA